MAASDSEVPLLVGVETEARAPVWSVSCIPVPDDKCGRFRVLACAGGGQNETPNSLVSPFSPGARRGPFQLGMARVGGLPTLQGSSALAGSRSTRGHPLLG